MLILIIQKIIINYFKKLNGYIPAKDESLKIKRNGFFYFSESLKKNDYRKCKRSW